MRDTSAVAGINFYARTCHDPSSLRQSPYFVTSVEPGGVPCMDFKKNDYYNISHTESNPGCPRVTNVFINPLRDVRGGY